MIAQDLLLRVRLAVEAADRAVWDAHDAVRDSGNPLLATLLTIIEEAKAAIGEAVMLVDDMGIPFEEEE